MRFETGNLIHLSNADGRLLPGRILWCHGPYVAAEMSAESICDEEQNFHLYFESNRQFVQQPTVVEGILDRPAAELISPVEAVAMDLDEDPSTVVVVFELLGAPTVSDNRECYRVRTASYGIQVVFADRDDCELMDVSQTGFALVSRQKFENGMVVRACLPDGDRPVCGPVRIQSVRQLRDGRFRYGVVCLNSETEVACANLAMEFQRQQLQDRCATA